MSWCHYRVSREILQKSLTNSFHATTQQIYFSYIRFLLVLSCRGSTVHERKILWRSQYRPRNGADVKLPRLQFGARRSGSESPHCSVSDGYPAMSQQSKIPMSPLRPHEQRGFR